MSKSQPSPFEKMGMPADAASRQTPCATALKHKSSPFERMGTPMHATSSQTSHDVCSTCKAAKANAVDVIEGSLKDSSDESSDSEAEMIKEQLLRDAIHTPYDHFIHEKNPAQTTSKTRARNSRQSSNTTTPDFPIPIDLTYNCSLVNSSPTKNQKRTYVAYDDALAQLGINKTPQNPSKIHSNILMLVDDEDFIKSEPPSPKAAATPILAQQSGKSSANTAFGKKPKGDLEECWVDYEDLPAEHRYSCMASPYASPRKTEVYAVLRGEFPGVYCGKAAARAAIGVAGSKGLAHMVNDLPTGFQVFVESLMGGKVMWISPVTWTKGQKAKE